jgi:hypothetical protein
MEQMQRLEVSETATPEELEAVAQDLSTKVSERSDGCAS